MFQKEYLKILVLQRSVAFLPVASQASSGLLRQAISLLPDF